MSEFGAGITVWRKDGQAVSKEEAQRLVNTMESLANASGKHGAFDDGAPDCGIGWSEEGGGYTLVAQEW